MTGRTHRVLVHSSAAATFRESCRVSTPLRASNAVNSSTQPPSCSRDNRFSGNTISGKAGRDRSLPYLHAHRDRRIISLISCPGKTYLHTLHKSDPSWHPSAAPRSQLDLRMWLLVTTIFHGPASNSLRSPMPPCGVSFPDQA